MIQVRNDEGVFMYRHNPYQLELLPGRSYHDKVGAAIVFFEKKKTLPTDRSSSCDVSDTSSESAGAVSSPIYRHVSSPQASKVHLAPVHMAQNPTAATTTTIRYATVAFKFATVTCIAPFRCASGDVVVVADSTDGSINVGVVRSILPNKPNFFVAHELIRHARDYDRTLKNEAMAKEAGIVARASNMMLPLRFHDVEFYPDSSTIAFLVDAFEPQSSQPLTELLSQQFGCKVLLRMAEVHLPVVPPLAFTNTPPPQIPSPAYLPESPCPL